MYVSTPVTESRRKHVRCPPMYLPKPSPMQAEMLENLAKTFPSPGRILEIVSKVDPKSMQKPSWSPSKRHLAPMTQKSFSLNAQKMTKRRPRGPTGGPRSPQTPAKWSPQPSQILFLKLFLAFFFQCKLRRDFQWMLD